MDDGRWMIDSRNKFVIGASALSAAKNGLKRLLRTYVASNINDRLDDAGFGEEPGGEGGGDVVEGGAVGDPGVGVDLTGGDHIEDAVVVGGDRVAAGEDGGLAAVELRV